MSDIKKLSKIILTLLLIWMGAAALLSFFTELTYTDSVLLIAALIGFAIYWLHRQSQAAKNLVFEQQESIYQAIINYVYSLIIDQKCGTNLIKPTDICEVDRGWRSLSDQSLVVYVRMQSVNRLPLSAKEKQTLQHALQTDIDFAIGSQQIACRKVVVRPIYTTGGAEWAKIEVTI